MHHYQVAKEAVETAIATAADAGWSEKEVLQSFIVLAVERYQKLAGAKDAKAILEYELQNLSGKIDYDFARSR